MSIKKQAEKAFKELEKLGAPVKSSEGYQGRGFFWISAEEEESGLWLDYFDLYWGSQRLQDVLEKHGLYFEWENPGFATVHEV